MLTLIEQKGIVYCVEQGKRRGGMKNSKKLGLVLLLVGMAMASTAFADAGGGNDSKGSDNGKGNGGQNNGNGNGDGAPAAPEPGIALMVTAGVMLGGGYLVLRRRQAGRKSAS